MLRKILCLAAAVGAAAALAVPAMASEELGSIQVTLSDTGANASDGSVMLYQVATPLGPDYGLTETFGSGIIKGEDAMSPILAKWLAGSVEVDGWEKALNQEGSTKFEELPQGLYLLVQSQTSAGFEPLTPMLIQMPCEGQWHVTAFPEIHQSQAPPTGQTMEPFLGAAGMVLSGTGLMLCRRKRR